MADKETSTDKTPAAPKEPPMFKGSLSADKPIVAPDGHVNLSQEDIDARAG